MDHMKKNRQIANRLYDLGLEKAKIRDLTGAAEYLKKSLRFDKYQTDARNLLGLIFYETGETAEALVQWVISMNLKPQDNLAGGYVEELRRRSGELERSGLALYASALREDTAEIRTVPLSRCAVVIGSEGRGVSQALLDWSEKTVKIPMRLPGRFRRVRFRFHRRFPQARSKAGRERFRAVS